MVALEKKDPYSEQIWAFKFGDVEAAMALLMEMRDKGDLTMERLETVLTRGGPGLESKWQAYLMA